jgi:hypothetical protein
LKQVFLVLVYLYVTLLTLYSIEKPEGQAKLLKNGNFELSKELVNYYINIEEKYLEQQILLDKYELQINNYKSLISEKDLEIKLLNRKLTFKDDLIEHYEFKLEEYKNTQRQLILYKTGFNISIAFNVGSFLAIGGAVAGYYIFKNL